MPNIPLPGSSHLTPHNHKPFQPPCLQSSLCPPATLSRWLMLPECRLCRCRHHHRSRHPHHCSRPPERLSHSLHLDESSWSHRCANSFSWATHSPSWTSKCTRTHTQTHTNTFSNSPPLRPRYEAAQRGVGMPSGFITPLRTEVFSTACQKWKTASYSFPFNILRVLLIDTGPWGWRTQGSTSPLLLTTSPNINAPKAVPCLMCHLLPPSFNPPGLIDLIDKMLIVFKCGLNVTSILQWLTYITWWHGLSLNYVVVCRNCLETGLTISMHIRKKLRDSYMTQRPLAMSRERPASFKGRVW